MDNADQPAEARGQARGCAGQVGGALYVVVGLPGAGKTTRASQLAGKHRAVRLNPDEWMTDLAVDLYDEPFRSRLEQRMSRLAGELLAAGGRVVIEFGSWSRAERDALLALGRGAGARVELHVLDPDVEELWHRLADRNKRPGQTQIDRATLDSYVPYWERPDEDELARYDAHDDD